MTYLRAYAPSVTIAALFLSVGLAQGADIQVIDGGTLVVDGRKISLWGVEAPQAGQVCTTSAGRTWPCGERVRKQVLDLVAAEAMSCQPKAPGREVCRVAGLDLGALLVKEGLAKASGDYQEIEARARTARVGLWE